MKKTLLVALSIIIRIGVLIAQEQNYYLTEAIKLLLKDSVESAERHYNLYKKMTSNTDADFEVLLEEKKSNRATSKSWEDDCYIIRINSDTCLAVQKNSVSNKKCNWNNAVRIATFSRLGGFSDWHIPSMEEMSIVLSNLSKINFCCNGNSNAAESCYWTTTKKQNLIVNLHCDNSIDTGSANTECNYVVVRKFRSSKSSTPKCSIVGFEIYTRTN
jgi:hypothetical protein